MQIPSLPHMSILNSLNILFVSWISVFHDTICDLKITSYQEVYVSYLVFYVVMTVFMYYRGSIGIASFYGANVRPVRHPHVRPG